MSEMNERKTIMCCLPGFNFSSLWVNNWTSLLCWIRDRFNISVVFGYSNNIYITRNSIVKNVLETEQAGQKIDYVLWMDDDNLLDYRQFEMLLNLLEKNEQISGAMGWYWLQPQGRQIDPSPSVGLLGEVDFVPFDPKRMFAEPPVELVSAGGFGCFLMKWEDFKKVGEQAFSPILLEESKWGFAGDDIAFFMRAKKLGLNFLVDKRIKVPHLKVRDANFNPLPFLDVPSEIVGALAIDGWMDHNELRWLYQQACKMVSVVEIGSWKGRSAYALLAGCKGLVYCVDTWQGASDIESLGDERKSLYELAKGQDIFGEFKRNVGHFDNLMTYHTDSVLASTDISDVDMVFIDAEHTTEAVIKDLEAWQGKARKLLCGHDVDRVEVQEALRIKGIDWKKGPGSIWFYEIAKEQSLAASN